MAAIAPYYVHSPDTVDSQIGLNADPISFLADSVSGSPGRNEIIHQRYNASEAVLIANTPTNTLAISGRVMARSSGYNNAHPGTALSRATISQFRAGVNHGFDTTEGWWIVGALTHGQPRGDLDEVSFTLKNFGFATSASGTLVTTNPA